MPLSRIKRSPNGLVVAFAAWTALAAFVVGQRYFFALSMGTPFNLLLAAVENFSSCWLWAAITPLIFELSRRFPLQAGVWRKNLMFHVMFSVLFLLADVLQSFEKEFVVAPPRVDALQYGSPSEGVPCVAEQRKWT